MKCAVIGGAGFIGSHVVDKLVKEGHDVVVFDIMRPDRNDVKHIHIDITDLSSTTIALTGNYDVVYLLAAMANVNDIYKNPVEATRINVLGTVNVLEAARRNNIGRVILSSTVWVYEMATQTEVSSDTEFSPQKANHVYTATKLASEMLCQSYYELYGAPEYTVLRYGIPYGTRARSGILSAIFVDKALKGEPLTIQGDGSQYRNFIYVEDLADGNVAALQDVAKNKIYNLEGMRKVTVKEVAETVKTLIPGDVNIVYEPGRAGDYKGKDISTENTKNDLGWEPKVDFEEGMSRYVEWFQKECV